MQFEIKSKLSHFFSRTSGASEIELSTGLKANQGGSEESEVLLDLSDISKKLDSKRDLSIQVT